MADPLHHCLRVVFHNSVFRRLCRPLLSKRGEAAPTALLQRKDLQTKKQGYDVVERTRTAGTYSLKKRGKEDQVKLLPILLFLPLFTFAQWSHESINGSFADHAGACALLTLGTTVVVDYVYEKITGRDNWEYSRVFGFAVGMACGLLKEFLEQQPDEIDLIADFTGCCVGVALTITIPIKKWRY